MNMNCVGFLFFFQCQGPPPAINTNVVCPPLIEIDVGTQRRVGAELRGLPPDSALRAFVNRSIEQRDLVRSCQQERAKRRKK